MENKENKFSFKEFLFTEWVFSCVYWGVFAIIWHFSIYFENDYPGRSIIYESNLLVPISSIAMYIMGSYFVYMDKITTKKSTSSRSNGSSDKQP